MAGYDLTDGPAAALLVPFFNTLTQECVSVLHVQLGLRIVTYYHLRSVSFTTPKTMAICGAALAGNFRAGLSESNHMDFYSRPVELTPPEVDIMGKIKTIHDMPRSRITQDHHMYITWHELLAGYKTIHQNKSYDARMRCAVASLIIDEAKRLDIYNKVSMSTHLTYVLVAPLFAVRHLAWIALSSSNDREYMWKLKAEGGAAKQLQTLFRDDLAQVYELQVLRNRVYDSVDWDKEMRNRREPKTVPIAYSTVLEHAVRIFVQAKKAGARQSRKTWRQYWEERWSSMPVGSVVSQYQDDIELKRRLPTDARVKAAWFAAASKGNHTDWLQRKPEIYASTSTKYEWGKVRALYGCDVTSFLHADFAMSDCEATLPPYFPVGPKANDKYVRNVIDKFTDGVPFCYDFDDFNAQHSTASMQAVIEAWGSVFGSNLTDEQKASLQWTFDSVATQRVKYNDVGVTQGINGTLLSGWRLTSFINTVLNRVYLLEAGIEDNTIYALHNGDDVYATTPSVGHAVELAKTASKLGVRAQMAKMNIGTIGEFLRIDSRAVNSTSAQYLARAVSTAVHGRVEIAPANDLRELERSMSERYEAMYKRGARLAPLKAMRKQNTAFNSKLFQTPITVINAFHDYHPLQGGCNEQAEVGATRIEKRAMDDIDVVYDKFRPIKLGINDYANAMARKFGMDFSVPDREQMFRQAVNALIKKKIRYEIVIETDRDIVNHRGIYRAWRGTAWITPITKARSLGYVSAKELVGIDSGLANMIRNDPQPTKVMSAAF